MSPRGSQGCKRGDGGVGYEPRCLLSPSPSSIFARDVATDTREPSGGDGYSRGVWILSSSRTETGHFHLLLLLQLGGKLTLSTAFFCALRTAEEVISAPSLPSPAAAAFRCHQLWSMSQSIDDALLFSLQCFSKRLRREV